MRTMIVDDAGFIREMLSRLLRNFGHDIVAEAHTGPEAISLYQATKPNLIFLDLVLPEMNGLEVAREIIAHGGSDCSIIAMSALTQDWIQKNAAAAGYRYFLAKPFNEDAVLKAISAATQIQRQEVKHG